MEKLNFLEFSLNLACFKRSYDRMFPMLNANYNLLIQRDEFWYNLNWKPSFLDSVLIAGKSLVPIATNQMLLSKVLS